MDSERQLIEGCLKRDPKAQEALYRHFGAKMYGLCLRYARNPMEAEDILQEGFIKVYTHLHDYRFEGSFEGWIRRTFVNTAINYFKKKSRELVEVSLDDLEFVGSQEENAFEKLSTEELLGLIQKLPEGYRIVFNLYIVEGYSHKEISEMMHISESTSKSQLSRARLALQKMVREHNTKAS